MGARVRYLPIKPEKSTREAAWCWCGCRECSGQCFSPDGGRQAGERHSAARRCGLERILGLTMLRRRRDPVGRCCLPAYLRSIPSEPLVSVLRTVPRNLNSNPIMYNTTYRFCEMFFSWTSSQAKFQIV
eukprot:758592-Hanusia_phi.AAC.7